MELFHKNSQDMISIRMRRDSVSMGDDCMAPHEVEIQFAPSDDLYDLLHKAAEYVPPMHDFEWKVMCGADVVGRLVSGTEAKYQIKPEGPNMKISSLPEKEIFCRQCYKNVSLSYFERIEALYGGDYFYITVFQGYDDIKTILEKGVTKITTCDKKFALAHGFHHRELQWYDKLLKIDDFEGLRIVRIPNKSNMKTEYIEIPKAKVIEELERRAGIASADSGRKSPEVMKYCPNCGKKNNGGTYCIECGTKLLKGYGLENIGNKVIFTCKGKEYELRSHPYEPCLYIYSKNEMIKILHNAFEVYDLVDRFEAGETEIGPDGSEYDKESFCKVLAAALNDERYEMNWTFAAKLADN